MEIDKRILKDTVFIKDLQISELRLLKDGDLDWFVLVPKVPGTIELIDLSLDEQELLLRDIDRVSRILKQFSNPDKINIGALGNMVPQLHIHIIARYKSDRAWPNAVWGTKSKKNYQDYMAKEWIQRFN